MKEQDAIVLLKGMQNPLQDYADMVGAPAFVYGHQYVYQEPEDYSIEEAIVALREKQSRKWIPVEERLPESETMVLAYIKRNDVEDGWRTYQVCKYTDHWIGTGNLFEVVAWMPLPEPYNPQN